MDEIARLEQEYRLWRNDLEAGRVDEAPFVSAVDALSFQDDGGRYWMLGLHSGQWYYYEDQRWQQADSGQARQALLGWVEPDVNDDVRSPGWMAPPESAPAPGVGYLDLARLATLPLKAALVMSFAVMVVLALVWPVGGAPPAGPMAAPSPRPPLDGGSGGGDGGGGGSGGGGNGGSSASGAILGQVTDLSTQQPGAGLEVSVGEQIVRTDTDGSYSITGLAAGAYAVQVIPAGLGTPAHGPITVSVDGLRSVRVDLNYYSQAAPIPTNTPPVVAAAVSPPALPPSGASKNHVPPLVICLGLALVL